MLNKCFLVLISAVVIIAIYFPARHARHYDYIDDKYILNELVISKTSNSDNLKRCSYENLVLNSSDIEYEGFYRKTGYEQPLKGKFQLSFPQVKLK